MRQDIRKNCTKICQNEIKMIQEKFITHDISKNGTEICRNEMKIRQENAKYLPMQYLGMLQVHTPAKQ